ncbi:hypothetical protein EVAR_42705_1 [Eumeta japonica]|uniref:Uncharacterized protein n=1 Tax=Eumeta variegata TaxID=151549 RepID=A0A4C1X0N9_EUMVA|nr:hypothetical protein EVAR_42705_1 [Eumeta japonica]
MDELKDNKEIPFKVIAKESSSRPCDAAEGKARDSGILDCSATSHDEGPTSSTNHLYIKSSLAEILSYNARNSTVVKLITKALQWRKIGTRGRRRKDQGALNLRNAPFAGNPEWQFLTYETSSDDDGDSSQKKTLLSRVSVLRQRPEAFFGDTGTEYQKKGQSRLRWDVWSL